MTSEVHRIAESGKRDISVRGARLTYHNVVSPLHLLAHAPQIIVNISWLGRHVSA